jgi:FkbM family methyltransferase
MEVFLRKLIPKLRLYNYSFLVSAYEKYALVRYRNKFDQVIQFRGASFIIGKDVTLFPSVFVGTYESCELDTLLSHNFQDDLVFWDVGANVGLYSTLFGLKYPNSKIVAFEPNLGIHQLLNQNFYLNGLINYRIVEYALSNRLGTGDLLTQESRAGAGKLDLDSSNNKGNGIFLVTTGDEFLRLHPELIPNLIKIDVEGHEPEVIDGMLGIIQKYKPVITVEVFLNLWEGERYSLWQSTISNLFNIYKGGVLVSDGNLEVLDSWSPSHLTGGMQTLMFNIDPIFDSSS